ncbi:hypothetical protein N5B96_08920 [Acinetobacter johnsonii]|nr:hypothetical protein [Acinetobacter johnsonii]MDH1069606.1 hypothetical protein [Acinetobacter johnsonii]
MAQQQLRNDHFLMHLPNYSSQSIQPWASARNEFVMMMQNVMIAAKVRGLGPCHERMESSSCSRAEYT